MITKEIIITIEPDETGYDVLVNGEPIIGIDHPVPLVHMNAMVSLLRIAYEAGKENLVLKIEEVASE